MRQKPPFSKCCEIVTRLLDTSQPSCRARRFAAASMWATETATSSAMSSAVKVLLISIPPRARPRGPAWIPPTLWLMPLSLPALPGFRRTEEVASFAVRKNLISFPFNYPFIKRLIAHHYWRGAAIGQAFDKLDRVFAVLGRLRTMLMGIQT